MPKLPQQLNIVASSSTTPHVKPLLQKWYGSDGLNTGDRVPIGEIAYDNADGSPDACVPAEKALQRA